MLTSSPGLDRHGFPLGWTPELDANDLFRIVMDVGKRVNTTQIREKTAYASADMPNSDHLNQRVQACSHDEQGFRRQRQVDIFPANS